MKTIIKTAVLSGFFVLIPAIIIIEFGFTGLIISGVWLYFLALIHFPKPVKQVT